MIKKRRAKANESGDEREATNSSALDREDLSRDAPEGEDSAGSRDGQVREDGDDSEDEEVLEGELVDDDDAIEPEIVDGPEPALPAVRSDEASLTRYDALQAYMRDVHR